MSQLDDLSQAASALDEIQIELLTDMARALARKVEEDRCEETDICTPEFAANFCSCPFARDELRG